MVSSERLVLWRSEIFGGISNEISVILDESTLVRDMEGMSFTARGLRFYFENVVLQLKAT